MRVTFVYTFKAKKKKQNKTERANWFHFKVLSYNETLHVIWASVAAADKWNVCLCLEVCFFCFLFSW